MLKSSNITEGIYNFILKKKLACLTYIGVFRSSREKYGNSRINFLLTEVPKKDGKENNRRYFTVKHIYTNAYLRTKAVKNKNFEIRTSKTLIKNAELSFQWEFLKVEQNTFVIYNREGCYLREEKNGLICVKDIQKVTEFHLLKLYQEVKITEDDELILEKEPIDVVIKYIDLSDPNLVREGIKQIKKDQDNEELRYSVRSILKNIPWIRKIFILMPNERVRFFKDPELINEKIVYVKDKDVLGYDSSNSHAFQYRIWKMKEFGLSDNIIYMDDDCFIGQPLKKSDFFYVENNKVVPAIINVNYEVQTNATAKKEYSNLEKKVKLNKREQTSSRFMYSVYKTYLFFIKYLDSPIIVPYFTHNAIPSNLNDLKELYDIIYNSEHRFATLDSKFRHTETLQFQASVVLYTYNKYKRKAHPLKYNYIDNDATVYGKFNFPLYCINTGNNKDYAEISFAKTRLVMENLFPMPTEYEIYDNTIVPNKAFKVMNVLDDELTKLKKQKQLDDIDKEKFENEKISKEYEKCSNQIDMYKAQNESYINKTILKRKEIENCKISCSVLEYKRNQLKIIKGDYIAKEDIKQKINEIMKNNQNITKIFNEYKSLNDNYLLEIKKIEKKNKRLYFFIYFELTLIIIFAGVIGIYYPLRNKYDNNKNNVNNRNSYNNISSFRRISKKENNEKLELFDENEMNEIK